VPATHTRLDRWRTTAYVVWAVIGTLLLLAVSGWVLGRISSALAPFVIAFLIVFFLQASVNRLEARGLERGRAVLLCFVVAFVVLSVAMVFLVPALTRQLVAFAASVPDYLNSAEALIHRAQQQYSTLVIPDWIRTTAQAVVTSLSQVFVRAGNAAAKGVVSAGSGFAAVVFDLFLGVVVAFWTLKDLPAIREELRLLAGEKYEDDLENLLATITHVVGGYLKGQTIASLVTGTLAGIGLAIIGVPYALMLGIVTLIFNYIPYVGPFVAGLLAAAAGLFVGWPQALGAIAIVIGAQQLTDLFVTPRVMSDQVDLHPTLVIFSLLVGGTLFGFWGLIFAIPVAGTAKGLFVYYYERKTKRQLGSEDGALFRTSQCDDDSEEPCDDEQANQSGDASSSGANPSV